MRDGESLFHTPPQAGSRSRSLCSRRASSLTQATRRDAAETQPRRSRDAGGGARCGRRLFTSSPSVRFLFCAQALKKELEAVMNAIAEKMARQRESLECKERAIEYFNEQNYKGAVELRRKALATLSF